MGNIVTASVIKPPAGGGSGVPADGQSAVSLFFFGREGRRMNTRCVSGCLQDVEAPIRVSFMKLYQWPQSDAEFVRFISKREEKSTGSSNSRASWRGHENYSSRQMYLRSYTFCREEETVAGKTRKWLSEKKRTKVAKEKRTKVVKEKRKPVPVRVVAVVRRMKDKSVSGVCSVFEVVFECLFSCMARVDVVEFK